MKTMLILRGLPGSGKSDFADYIKSLKQVGTEIFSADDFFMKNGEYKFNPKELPLAHEHCFNQTEIAANIGLENIIIANTNTTEKEFSKYAELGEKYGYKIFTLIVENRHGNQNIHDVPSETLQKMEKRFEIKLI